MRKVIIVIASLMLVTGIGFLLFEPVSTSVNKHKAEQLVEEFEENLKQIEKSSKIKNKKTASSSSGTAPSSYSGEYSLPTVEQLERLLKASKKYNKSIISNQGTVDTSDYSSAAVNLKKYGIYNNMYGYISAPAVGLKQPIYLGANESVMNSGAAHLDNTSLPINGKSVNCAIAGHSGYTGRIFFDGIKQLKIGDEVNVRNYWSTLHYKVIKAHRVPENNTNDLYIRPDRRLLTLITCIYRENNQFDRYIVVCELK